MTKYPLEWQRMCGQQKLTSYSEEERTEPISIRSPRFRCTLPAEVSTTQRPIVACSTSAATATTCSGRPRCSPYVYFFHTFTLSFFHSLTIRCSPCALFTSFVLSHFDFDVFPMCTSFSLSLLHTFNLSLFHTFILSQFRSKVFSMCTSQFTLLCSHTFT